MPGPGAPAPRRAGPLSLGSLFHHPRFGPGNRKEATRGGRPLVHVRKNVTQNRAAFPIAIASQVGPALPGRLTSVNPNLQFVAWSVFSVNPNSGKESSRAKRGYEREPAGSLSYRQRFQVDRLLFEDTRRLLALLLVVVQPGPGRDELADDHVFLQAPQPVDLARDGGLGQDAGGLLEGRCRKPRGGVERGLDQAEQHGLG